MDRQSPNSVLYVLATPIGNLGDLSERAKQTLSKVDLIAAEDTRHTASLLAKLKIPTPKLVSYYDQIEQTRSDELIEQMLASDIEIALVSDAGTPCISDPGYRLVAKAKKSGIKVVPIPGPCAITSLLSSAGLPCHRFAFVGFLPTKKMKLDAALESWKNLEMSVICYESPRRLLASLEAIEAHYPHAFVAIGRELTKLHEEIHTLALAEAMAWAKAHTALKGELVMMVDPNIQPQDKGWSIERIRSEAMRLRRENPKLSHKDLVAHFKAEGLAKKEIYALLLSLESPLD